MKELITILDEIATNNEDTNPHVSIILYTLCGAILVGKENELSELALYWSKKQRDILNTSLN